MMLQKFSIFFKEFLSQLKTFNDTNYIRNKITKTFEVKTSKDKNTLNLGVGLGNQKLF